MDDAIKARLSRIAARLRPPRDTQREASSYLFQRFGDLAGGAGLSCQRLRQEKTGGRYLAVVVWAGPEIHQGRWVRFGLGDDGEIVWSAGEGKEEDKPPQRLPLQYQPGTGNGEWLGTQRDREVALSADYGIPLKDPLKVFTDVLEREFFSDDE